MNQCHLVRETLIARAGIQCEIFVPEGTSPKKIDLIRAHGATCTIVPGTRDHCADVCREKVEKGEAYYANHVYNPFFYEGTKTYIYETWEQLGRIPEYVLLPVGNGSLFLGAVLKRFDIFRFPAVCSDILCTSCYTSATSFLLV